MAAPHPLAPHLSQGDGGHVAEVVVDPFEPQVRFLPDNEGDVSWDDVGTLKAKGKKRGNGDGKGLGRGRRRDCLLPAGWGEKKGIFVL